MSVLMRPILFSMPFRQDNVKLLRYLGGGTKNLEFNKVILPRFIVSDQCSRDDIPEINALIDLYSKPHVFNHTTGGHFQTLEAVRLFKSMVSDHDESFPPNNIVSGLVLSSCLNIGHLLLGRQCHGYLLKSGLELNQYVKTRLVRLYSMLSDVIGAMEVLVCKSRLDTRSYNLILVGLVEKGYLDEALVILRRMLPEDMVWNKATYIGSFDLCARLKDLNLGRQVHNKLLKSDDAESVCSAMLNMYWKCGEISSAKKVIRRFEHRNVVIWTTFLAAYLEQGSLKELFMFFFKMIREDVVPNESTFCVLLNASAGIFSYRLGRSFHALVVKTVIEGHKNVEDALINMYSRTGDIKAAEKVFSGMTDRDIVTWNTMICGYCHHGLGNESLALFQEMLRLGVDPDYVSFVGVLSACGQVGLVEEGFYYLYELMKEKGVEPGLEHYTCILNMLIKAGQLNEALSFILLTPSKWDVYAWTSLLSGCRAHGNNTLGIRVAELIPDDVATKVSKLCGVKEVRELLEIRDDIKQERGSGSCRVEIEDRTYEFASVDKGDPIFATSNVYMKTFWKTIIQSFSAMSDDEIEDGMERHRAGYLSEEITLAFALFKTHDKAPIFILKTAGKISAQMHSLMKLLSKVTARLIMVRDAHFLHRFEDGPCSCGDYW